MVGIDFFSQKMPLEGGKRKWKFHLNPLLNGLGAVFSNTSFKNIIWLSKVAMSLKYVWCSCFPSIECGTKVKSAIPEQWHNTTKLMKT